MNLYLIGGAPCSGKSTFARNLASELNCSWISTDILRDVMRSLVTVTEYPEFFDSVNLTAEEYYHKYDVKQVFPRELLEAEITQLAVTNFISKLESYGHWENYVIEGIALTPAYIHKLQKKFTEITIYSKVLYVNDKAEIKKRIYSRGLWDDANKYPDWIKEIEVAWVLEANEWFKNEALKYSLG